MALVEARRRRFIWICCPGHVHLVNIRRSPAADRASRGLGRARLLGAHACIRASVKQKHAPDVSLTTSDADSRAQYVHAACVLLRHRAEPFAV